MPAGPHYRPVDPMICQGDIISGVPHLVLQTLPLKVVRGPIGKPERPIYGLYSHPGPEPKGGPCKIGQSEGELVAARGYEATAIVLDHDCDMQVQEAGRHTHKYRLVALVRTIAPTLHPDQKDILRGNRNFDHFYLPPDAAVEFPESYVDFGRITCLSPEFLSAGRRLLSMTEEFVTGLHFQLIQFFTRREILS